MMVLRLQFCSISQPHKLNAWRRAPLLAAPPPRRQDLLLGQRLDLERVHQGPVPQGLCRSATFLASPAAPASAAQAARCQRGSGAPSYFSRVMPRSGDQKPRDSKSYIDLR